MRIVFVSILIVTLALLAIPGAIGLFERLTGRPVFERVPNMTCKADGGAAGPELRRQEVSDVFRVEDGQLYHRWGGVNEYLYNKIERVGFKRYVAGHMMFVMTDDERRGYVVIASPSDWRIVYLDCKS